MLSDPTNMTFERLLLLLLSLAFTVVTFSLLTIIKRFIESKPPGRRLVTSDVHILKVRGCSKTTLPITATQAAVLKMLILSVTVPLALRACLGPLPFSVAFAATESLKVHITSHEHIVVGTAYSGLSLNTPRCPTPSMGALSTFLQPCNSQ